MKVLLAVLIPVMTIASSAKLEKRSPQDAQTSSPFRIAKSTGSFDIRTKVQRLSTPHGATYHVEVQVYELAAIENFELHVFAEAPAHLVTESELSKNSNVWSKIIQIETPDQESRLVLEARGSVEGSPIGDSRSILLNRNTGGTMTKAPLQKGSGFFPPGTQF